MAFGPSTSVPPESLSDGVGPSQARGRFRVFQIPRGFVGINAETPHSGTRCLPSLAMLTTWKLTLGSCWRLTGHLLQAEPPPSFPSRGLPRSEQGLHLLLLRPLMLLIALLRGSYHPSAFCISGLGVRDNFVRLGVKRVMERAGHRSKCFQSS